MFNNSKYTMWYFAIVDDLVKKARTKKDGVYYEKHHKIPRSLGGDNNPSNIVLLTGREHLICHMLLCRMTQHEHQNKMRYALWCMCNGLSNTRPVRITGRMFESIKSDYSRFRSENFRGANNHFFGCTHSEELKASRRGELNPTHRPEVRIKMRKPKSYKRQGTPHSEERKAKIANSLKGRKQNDATKAKKAAAKANLVWIHQNGSKPMQVKNNDCRLEDSSWNKGRGPACNW